MSDPAKQSLASRTARMWESGQSISSVEFLISSISGATLQERADAVLVDQSFRWKSGIEISAEHYLHRCPDLAADAKSRLSIVTGELRARGGSPQLLAEFADRFPDLEQNLHNVASM